MNTQWFGCLALAGLLASPVMAAEISVKSLAGPPEEFSAHRLPTAHDTKVASNILLIDRGSKSAKNDKNAAALPPGSSSTDFYNTAGVGFSVVQATTVYPYFAPSTFVGPDGSRYSFDGYSITCNWGYCDEYTASVEMEPFQNSAGGVAVFSISGGQVTTDGNWNLTVQDPYSVPTVAGTVQIESMVSFDDNVVEVGTGSNPCLSAIIPCEYEAATDGKGLQLVDGAAPVLRLSFTNRAMKQRQLESGIGLSALRVTVTDARTRQTVHQEQLSLSRLAGLPTDDRGANLIQLPSLSTGEYTVRLDVQGNVLGVGTVERTALYYLPILPRTYSLTGEVASAVLDSDRLELQLELDAPSGDSKHVFAYAEVWDGEGQKPIAWIGGMTQPRTDTTGRLSLPMVLDARWLALAGTSGNKLRLRNVRIQDADTFIPLSQISDLPVTVASLPRAASLEAAKVIKDDSLIMGKGDRSIVVADQPAKTTEDPRITFSNTGIFLVHGWCSGATWPVSHFGRPGRVGGTEVFSDPSASRSHDAFARLIRDQGAANFSDSFTVVAHSQGGAAATHLRAFYNSLLDLSNAPRRIQTMGTPYWGSSLMDYYLATGPLGWIIASIFGQCTPVFDLGTLGSSLWLSGVPSWARGEVFFYRTGFRRPSSFWERLQFWRWRCNAASFVIPGWDDGVVADWQGVLPGGNNMGVTESECHTGGMNHPGQTFNWNRNDILDREGRPQNINRARTATATASSSYTPGCSPGLHCYFPSRTNDGDRSTTLGGWTSWSNNNGAAMPQWLQLAWSTPITFTRVDLYLTAGYEMTSFRIEYRTSSTAPWQTMATVSGNTSSFRGPFTIAPTTAQAIRVVALSGSASQPGYARINEIEVY